MTQVNGSHEEYDHRKSAVLHRNINEELLNVVRGDTLGVDDVRDGRGRHFGLKLERVVDLIK